MPASNRAEDNRVGRLGCILETLGLHGFQAGRAHSLALTCSALPIALEEKSHPAAHLPQCSLAVNYPTALAVNCSLAVVELQRAKRGQREQRLPAARHPSKPGHPQASQRAEHRHLGTVGPHGEMGMQPVVGIASSMRAPQGPARQQAGRQAGTLMCDVRSHTLRLLLPSVETVRGSLRW